MRVCDTVNIDLARRGATPVFYAKQYDAQSRQLAFRLFPAGLPTRRRMVQRRCLEQENRTAQACFMTVRSTTTQ